MYNVIIHIKHNYTQGIHLYKPLIYIHGDMYSMQVYTRICMCTYQHTHETHKPTYAIIHTDTHVHTTRKYNCTQCTHAYRQVNIIANVYMLVHANIHIHIIVHTCRYKHYIHSTCTFKHMYTHYTGVYTCTCIHS